ncbi:MAG: HigA family addiction module antitoxin [Terriglobales bacterium]
MPKSKTRKPFAVHPGEVLVKEFLEPSGLSVYRLAQAVHSARIYAVARGERSISADTALRLGKYFGLPPQFWMNLQADYDLRRAAPRARLGTIRPRAA